MNNEEQTNLKIGALHLRLMDDEPNYREIIGQMAYYQKGNEHYTEDVLSALLDGLGNYERYLKIENALSPRSIKIIKRQLPEGQKLSAADTEGAYNIVLHFNDDTESVVHFSRKSEQLLYMLMLLCASNDGYTSAFLNKPDKDDYPPDDEDYESDLKQYNSVAKVVESIAELVYPKSNIKGLVRDLDPDSSFTDIVQKMRLSLDTHLQKHNQKDDKQWFLPHLTRYGKDIVYEFNLSSANISIPKEIMKLASKLPDADDYIDISEGIQPVDDRKFIRELTERAMEEGDVEAMNWLGNIYLTGDGAISNKLKAFQWYKKSAETGDAMGLSHMGTFYATGDCVSQDYTKAIDYWKKTLKADDEYDEAYFQLGLCSMHGFGCKKDWKKALSYFKQATELGHANAANEAGYILFNGGFGLKQNKAKAFEYYLDAADMDQPEAIRYVIRSFYEGIVEDEDDELEYWIERGKRLEMPEIWLQIGMMQYQDGQYEEAYEAFSEALDKGMFSASLILNTMLIKGMGVDPDPDLAKKVLETGVLGGQEEAATRYRQLYPEDWEKLKPQLDAAIDYHQLLIHLVNAMTPESNQEKFLKLIDAYREKFLEDKYISEINRQLSIHRPSTDNGGEDGRRRIVVRRSDSNKVGYEIVIILANGEEVVVNNINTNSLMIYLLAIICSYKSGYSTEMAKSDACKPIILYLYKSVRPDCKDGEARLFIENYLDTARNNYYKTYSSRAAQAITKAVDGKDDEDYYLFDNTLSKNRKVLRRMKLDVSDIELPGELIVLAQKMPDAKNILYPSEKQERIE